MLRRCNFRLHLRRVNILGFDVGGTSIKVGRYDASGNKLATERISTDSWRGSFVEKLISYLREVGDFQAAGIGLPGMINPERTTPIMIEAIRELDHINFLEQLKQAFPNAKFAVENDAMCAALGLSHAAPELGDDYLYIGFGTGIGSAAIMHGKPFLGPRGNALELGFVPMADGGHFEGNLGVQGLLRKYKSLGRSEIDALQLSEYLNDGSELSDLVLAYMTDQLKIVLAQAVLTLDLRTIAFGGGNAPKSVAFYGTLRQNINSFLPPYYHDIQLQRIEASPFMAARGAAMLVS